MERSLELLHKEFMGLECLRPNQRMTLCQQKFSLGIWYYFRLRNKPEIRLVLLTMPNCHLQHDEVRSLANAKVIVKVTESKEILYFLGNKEWKKLQFLDSSKIGTWRGFAQVANRWSGKKRFFDHPVWFSKEQLQECARSFHIGWRRRTIFRNSSQHKGATRHYVQKTLLLPSWKIKDDGTTILSYTTMYSSDIIYGRSRSDRISKAFSHILKQNAGCSPDVPESVHGGKNLWRIPMSLLKSQVSRFILQSCSIESLTG